MLIEYPFIAILHYTRDDNKGILEHRNGINQSDGDTLRVRSHCPQSTRPTSQLVTFMQQMAEDHQFATLHREEFHTCLQVPGLSVQAFLEESVGLVHTGSLVSTLNVSIPMRMETVVNVSDERQIFRMLRCNRILYDWALHVTDDAMSVEPLSGIHHIQIRNDRSFLVHIGSGQIEYVPSACCPHEAA